MERFYEYVMISRQGFYQSLKRYKQERRMMDQVKEEVELYRRIKDRRAGSRSLYYNLDIKGRYGLGVNKFEQLMSTYGLTILPLHIRVVTTQSTYRSWHYKNLANGLIINDINQLVVGDLTYINVRKYRYYLFCLTDVYSARIVGYEINERMRSLEAKRALKMWIDLRGKNQLKGSIHHTDGGSQYFSRHYVQSVQQNHIRISVAKNCLENGYAEQRNGLIKYHFIPTIESSTASGINDRFKKIIHFYNYERKQESLRWKSPVEYEAYIQTLSEKPKKRLYDYSNDKINGF